MFVNLSKAFDTINHEQLLHKLNHGICGLCNVWFKHYHSDRKQYLEYHNNKSNFDDITCGVPQGSILGPILFLRYINDIKNCTTSKLVSFADDTTIYYSSPNQNALFQNVNEELIKLHRPREVFNKIPDVWHIYVSNIYIYIYLGWIVLSLPYLTRALFDIFYIIISSMKVIDFSCNIATSEHKNCAYIWVLYVLAYL